MQQQKSDNLVKKSEQKTWLDISSRETYKWPKSTWKDAQHHKPLKKCKPKWQWDTTLQPVGYLLSKK